MKHASLYLVAAAFTFLTSCKDKEDPKPSATDPVKLTATINGAQQVPVNPSMATGTFTGDYNPASRVLTYTVTYQGMTPTGAHIHTGAPGTNGMVTVPFASFTSPITGTFPMTPEQADNLLNNRMYVNIHSMTSTGGEIRGDIRKQ